MASKKIIFSLVLISFSLGLISCGESNSGFSYNDSSFSNSIGNKTNNESHPYDTIKVKKVDSELRSDFAMGVDGSMISKIEELGGVYYNSQGQEQDVYQILRENGVNFFRLRLWNNPANKYGMTYGGGENSIKNDINMAKRAQSAGLNILIDFHYSDFWADPDDQQLPKTWQTLTKEEIPDALKTYTMEALTEFKDAGVNVDAVQIGNEINNGMCGTYGAIDWNNLTSSFDYIASLLKSGIEATHKVFPSCQTIIHLANGGNKDEFETYFTNLDSRNVNYDIIGASYYPNLSGDISSLQNNLDNISTKTGKPVMICETSWGFTDKSIEGVTANQYYSSSYEDVGGYLTSEQAQASCIRDIINVLANVPNQKGLGIFYWEPAWLPLAGACWATARGQSYKYTGLDNQASDYKDGLATWCNQGLFSYTGKALASLSVFKHVRNGFNEVEETMSKVRNETIELTLNIAAEETLPTTYSVETNYDAIRQANIMWDATSIEACKNIGSHTAHGVVNGVSVTANVVCIENFVVDPGFENQGETDLVKYPWSIVSKSPETDNVIKLDRKTDTRSGKTDLNWYHSSKQFSFDVTQKITLEVGTYHLNTFIMGIAPSDVKHNTLEVYITVDGTTTSVDMKDIISGWNDGYHATDEVVNDKNQPVLSGIEITSKTEVTIGIRGNGEPTAWGHNDDWSLVKQ